MEYPYIFHLVLVGDDSVQQPGPEGFFRLDTDRAYLGIPTFAAESDNSPVERVQEVYIRSQNGFLCEIHADKIIIGHQDLIDDSDYHLSLLKYGVNIAFDTCGKVAYMADEVRARNAKKIVEAGYGDHLVLSNDISRHTYFTTFGGSGYLAVMGSVVPLMRKEGLSEDMIRKFLIDNPARIVDNPRI